MFDLVRCFCQVQPRENFPAIDCAWVEVNFKHFVLVLGVFQEEPVRRFRSTERAVKKSTGIYSLPHNGAYPAGTNSRLGHGGMEDVQ